MFVRVFACAYLLRVRVMCLCVSARAYIEHLCAPLHHDAFLGGQEGLERGLEVVHEVEEHGVARDRDAELPR